MQQLIATLLIISFSLYLALLMANLGLVAGENKAQKRKFLWNWRLLFWWPTYENWLFDQRINEIVRDISATHLRQDYGRSCSCGWNPGALNRNVLWSTHIRNITMIATSELYRNL